MVNFKDDLDLPFPLSEGFYFSTFFSENTHTGSESYTTWLCRSLCVTSVVTLRLQRCVRLDAALRRPAQSERRLILRTAIADCPVRHRVTLAVRDVILLSGCADSRRVEHTFHLKRGIKTLKTPFLLPDTHVIDCQG